MWFEHCSTESMVHEVLDLCSSRTKTCCTSSCIYRESHEVLSALCSLAEPGMHPWSLPHTVGACRYAAAMTRYRPDQERLWYHSGWNIAYAKHIYCGTMAINGCVTGNGSFFAPSKVNLEYPGPFSPYEGALFVGIMDGTTGLRSSRMSALVACGLVVPSSNCREY